MNMSPVTRASCIFIVVILMAASLAAVLTLTGSDGPDLPSGDLPAFESEAQLNSYLRERGHEADLGNDSALEDNSMSGDTKYHSNTNVQVSGVDEIDRIKTDGQYIYIASSDRVSIVQAYPAEEMVNVSTIVMGDAIQLADDEQGYIQGIYLSSDMLVVICSCYSYHEGPSIAMDGWWGAIDERTMAFVVDVSEPGSPEVVMSGGVSGYSVGTRMVDTKLYIIAQSSILYMSSIEKPQVWSEGAAREMDATEIRFDPNATAVDCFTSIFTIDIKDGSQNITSVLSDWSSVLYVSEDNIYLTFERWDWSYVTFEGNEVIASTDDVQVTTRIVRLHMEDEGIYVAAVGDVDGYPLNQFSMDENDGHLRIATCSGWSERENMVFVLDMGLNVVGSLRGIAPNETIQAARFIGDTLYLVTYLQTDPLFVIDLGDPSAPAVIGELVVPGFSSYLHPVGDGYLVGIGMEDGRLKVSLYDVTVPEEPKEVCTILTDTWAWSDAQWDHKAVLFDERSGLLAIPVYSYDESYMQCQEEMFVFSVSDSGMALEGRLNNSDAGSSPRGVVIEDVLYTITTSSVSAWSVPGLEHIGSLVYMEQDRPSYWTYDLVGGARDESI